MYKTKETWKRKKEKEEGERRKEERRKEKKKKNEKETEGGKKKKNGSREGIRFVFKKKINDINERSSTYRSDSCASLINVLDPWIMASDLVNTVARASPQTTLRSLLLVLFCFCLKKRENQERTGRKRYPNEEEKVSKVRDWSRWQRLVKTGQDWQRLVKTGRDWSKRRQKDQGERYINSR